MPDTDVVIIGAGDFDLGVAIVVAADLPFKAQRHHGGGLGPELAGGHAIGGADSECADEPGRPDFGPP